MKQLGLFLISFSLLILIQLFSESNCHAYYLLIPKESDTIVSENDYADFHSILNRTTFPMAFRNNESVAAIQSMGELEYLKSQMRNTSLLEKYEVKFVPNGRVQMMAYNIIISRSLNFDLDQLENEFKKYGVFYYEILNQKRDLIDLMLLVNRELTHQQNIDMIIDLFFNAALKNKIDYHHNFRVNLSRDQWKVRQLIHYVDWLEYQSHKDKSFLLFRGTDGVSLDKEIQSKLKYFLDSALNFGDLSKWPPEHPVEMRRGYSLSFGCSLFGGFHFDLGANALYRSIHAKNGLGFKIPFNSYDSKIIFIPPLHPVLALEAEGDNFHPRSKMHNFHRSGSTGYVGGIPPLQFISPSDLTPEEYYHQVTAYFNQRVIPLIYRNEEYQFTVEVDFDEKNLLESVELIQQEEKKYLKKIGINIDNISW